MSIAAWDWFSRTLDEMPFQTEDAAAGLTRYEAEGSFALSLTRHNALRPESIWELKAQALKKNNLLTLYRGGERFDDLGGLSSLKDFCRRALRPVRSVKPRGILLLGVPGVGKSAFARALGNETGRPTLLLDIGALLGADSRPRGGQGEAASARPQPARSLPEHHPITTTAEASNADRNARQRCRSVGCYLGKPGAPR